MRESIPPNLSKRTRLRVAAVLWVVATAAAVAGQAYEVPGLAEAAGGFAGALTLVVLDLLRATRR